MEGLQLSNAKLLYIVNELFKQGTISETEKATIKGCRLYGLFLNNQ